ncbi:MAG: hypothetical protein IPK82_31470 [Polyangiaceae bacterium]|nr:hypothetical protein [Polyangiaceae bacterium]
MNALFRAQWCLSLFVTVVSCAQENNQCARLHQVLAERDEACNEDWVDDCCYDTSYECTEGQTAVSICSIKCFELPCDVSTEVLSACIMSCNKL